MSKFLTPNQIIGEIGENAVRGRFLTMGFQFDGRSRLEAGVDGIAEVMENGRPLARMIAVQIKSTENVRYASETDEGFTYLLRMQDLDYWKGSKTFPSSSFSIAVPTTASIGRRCRAITTRASVVCR